MGNDGLVHVALDGTTNCGAALLSPLSVCAAPTCIACMSDVMTCNCGEPTSLRYCGYAQEIEEKDSVCHCCDKCAHECAENI